MVNHIIFDCDGTLVDSEYLNLKAIFEVIGMFGVTHYDMDYAMTHFSGHRFSTIIGKISQDTGVTFPKDLNQLYLQKIRALAPTEMKAVEGAHNMVIAAQSCAPHLSVVSNGERNNVLYALELTELNRFFEEDDVITGLMAPNPKPAPDLFLLAAEKKDLPPAQSLVIEDSTTGVEAAIRAGMDVWGFYGTHHDPESQAHKLKMAGASRTFASTQGIVTALNKIKRA